MSTTSTPISASVRADLVRLAEQALDEANQYLEAISAKCADGRPMAWSKWQAIRLVRLREADLRRLKNGK